VFWHRELEYVQYLLDSEYLRGDAAVDALGWAEERREELNLRQVKGKQQETEDHVLSRPS
jgi:hypothetical protein